MVQLEWKTALVTGSSRGIGRGIIHKLVDAGIQRVAVNYVANDTAAHETAEMLKGKGAEVLLIKADCTDLDQVRRMFDKVRSDFWISSCTTRVRIQGSIPGSPAPWI
jgi:NAD(P)-dependent dehydrogenase (short-subunit alcohol dehydrogenase family)